MKQKTSPHRPPLGADSIPEPPRRTVVAGEADVLVAGGGIAGVAAAIAAARAGARVVLLEKESAPGGLATLGLIAVYLPICDGQGRQVMGGLAEHLLRRSIADGFSSIPPPWTADGSIEERSRQRFSVQFNPAFFLLEMERLLVAHGVALSYDTRVCGVRIERGRLTALMVEDKSGRRAWRCRAVVDATGDADVCALAGAPTARAAGNVPCGWFQYMVGGELRLVKNSAPYDPEGRPVGDGPFYAGDRAEEVTAHLLASRERIRRQLADLAVQHAPQKVFAIGVPTIAAFRMTRRLRAPFQLNARHAGRVFPDAVGLFGDWRRAGPVWGLPLRALLAPSPSNLAVAGRCISADRTLWDVTRAIPVCAVSGEAAGAAAALAARSAHPDFHRLSPELVRTHLSAHGAILRPPA